METKILGIWISIFLGCVFWRDSEFCPQEKSKIQIQNCALVHHIIVFSLKEYTLGIRLGNFR